MKRSKYNNFIGMYENVYEDGFCNHLVQEFDRLMKSGVCMNRKVSEDALKTTKEDTWCNLNIRSNLPSHFNGINSLDIFWEGLQNCFNDYVSEYDILSQFDLRCSSVKIQKTDPGGGYHIWHPEHGPDEMSNRCLVYILYLNDIDEAGETEFLYQKLRVPPKENCLVIWPAAFTHTHRGNVVHGNKSKYVVTGWFNIQ